MSVEPSDYVELRFVPRWTYINSVRKFVASFFMISLADQDRAEQISMATSELLENAVKYASEETLMLTITRTSGAVDVCVRNSADPEQLNALRREFALATAGDPERLYIAKMREAARTEGSGRLGLVRIRHEGGARLRLETDGGTVSMHAIFPLEPS